MKKQDLRAANSLRNIQNKYKAHYNGDRMFFKVDLTADCESGEYTNHTIGLLKIEQKYHDNNESRSFMENGNNFMCGIEKELLEGIDNLLLDASIKITDKLKELGVE